MYVIIPNAGYGTGYVSQLNPVALVDDANAALQYSTSTAANSAMQTMGNPSHYHVQKFS